MERLQWENKECLREAVRGPRVQGTFSVGREAPVLARESAFSFPGNEE